MIDESYSSLIDFMFGWGGGTLVTAIAFYPNFGSKYRGLLRQTKYLINSQKGIVSISDLAFQAEISPVKAAKFLKKLARQLEVEPEVSDSGYIYYVFDSGRDISQQLLLKDKSEFKF